MSPTTKSHTDSDATSEGAASSVLTAGKALLKWELPTEFGAYQLLDVLGTGAFGVVFRARQHSTRQIVALKVLRSPDVATEEERLRRHQRFERETQLCAELHHPHIVRLLDKGESNGHAYAVFEYVPGQTLRDYLLEHGPMSAAAAGALMGQVLDALANAHAHGVVHRDLKPQNIMVTNTGARVHAKVLDFGMGTLLRDARDASFKSLTMTLEAVGTPSYAAPEQLRGELPSTKSDFYAWGLVFVECLTGEPVMQGKTLAETFHRQLSDAPVPLPAAIIGHGLSGFLRRVLEKDPRERRDDAEQLFRDFQTLNLSNLVGELVSSRERQLEDAPTINSALRLRAQKRQITALCCVLRVYATGDDEPDPEILDTFQREQVRICTDTASRYGGHIASTFGEHVMVYYGYPDVSDNDARRAARTAMELVELADRSNARLAASLGIEVEIRVGIHTGVVVLRENVMPTGLTANIANRLAMLAQPSTVLVSEPTRHVLLPFQELERAGAHAVGGRKSELPTYRLKGEREDESGFMLRPESSQRPMIGRVKELEALLKCWTGAEDGEIRAALIVGEAGIGKSRLSDELRRRVQDGGTVVRACRCWPEHRNDALFPILGMLQRHLRLGDVHDPDEATERLEGALTACGCDPAATIPVLASWLSLPISQKYKLDSQPPNLQKKKLLEALHSLLEHLGGGRPFLLIVEDLHWIDPTSLDFLERFSRSASSPMMLLMTARPEFETRWKKDELCHVMLDRLADGAAESLIRSVLKDTPVHAATLARLAERTDGVPLFIEEFTRMLIDGEHLVQKDGAYVFRSDESSGTTSIPVTLRDSLSERLERLGVARSTAQMASAIGRAFEVGLVATASNRSRVEVLQDVNTLLEAGLLLDRDGGDDLCVFRHALIRDAAYDSMTRAVRQEVHGQLADALERDFADVVAQQPAELARHQAGAGRFSNAIAHGIRAMRASLVRSANAETTALGRQVLEWVGELPDEDARYVTEFEVNQLLFPALMAVAGLGAAELVELSRRNDQIRGILGPDHPRLRDGDDEINYLSQWILYQDHHFRSRCSDAIQLGERMVTDARAAEHRVHELLILPLLGQVYHFVGDLEQAKRHLDRALELYDDDSDTDLWREFGVEPKSQAMFLLSHVLCCMGLPESAVRVSEQALEWATKAGCSMSADGSVLFHSINAYLFGDREEVVRLTVPYDEDGHSAESQWLVSYCRLSLDWARKRRDRSEVFIDTLLSFGRTGAICWWEPLLAETESETGLHEAAVERMQVTSARCRAAGEMGPMPLLLRTLANALRARDGQMDSACEQHYRDALAEARRQQAKWLELDAAVAYARALEEAGRAAEVTALLDPLLAVLSEGHDTPLVKRAQVLRGGVSDSTE